MAIRYILTQCKIKNSTNYNLYYARAIILAQITTEQLCEEIAHSTTVTESDVRAVLAELKDKLNNHLGNSESVKLDGIGTFQPSFSCQALEKKEDFTTNKIKRVRINFRPATYVASRAADATGKTVKTKGLVCLKSPTFKGYENYKSAVDTSTTTTTTTP